MEKTNAQKGITLIALIITIVVLLILAVVAIKAVQDGGIIAHAKDAATKHTIAQEKEQIGLAQNEWAIQKHYQNNKQNFQGFMYSKLVSTGIAKSVSPNEDGSLTVEMKSGNVYTVDENGNITKQENGEDKVTGDFEITVSQTNNSLLIIRATIPESWNDREFTKDDEDLAAQIVGDYTHLRIDGERVTNLKELIIAGVNDKYGDILSSTLGKTFSKDDYDTMIPIMQSMLPADVDISKPEKAFEYMMQVMGEKYKTVQEFAEAVDEYEYEATTKVLKIRKNGGEWTDITEIASWSEYDASYIVTENGDYEIQLELDENTATKMIEVNSAEHILWTEAKSSNQTYAGASTGSSTNPIIPAGFMPKNTKTAKWDAEGGPEADNGLVIVDSVGNEFVWVPVTTPLNPDGYNVGTTTSVREPDVVIGNGNQYDAVSTNLQRAECEDMDKDGALEAEDFKIQLTNEYKAMVESVNQYNGFYVGRYETSRNGQNPQSKSGIGITSVTAAEDSANTWYGLYAINKKYKTSSVQGSMIWGSQYEAMMSWIEVTDDTTIGDQRNQDRTCGTAPDDVIKNVYDLYGNSYEWTLEAGSIYGRVHRGR